MRLMRLDGPALLVTLIIAAARFERTVVGLAAGPARPGVEWWGVILPGGRRELALVGRGAWPDRSDDRRGTPSPLARLDVDPARAFASKTTRPAWRA